MPVQVVQRFGPSRPQNIGPKLLMGISPPGTPVSESKPPMLLDSDFEFFGSSQDGWSRARVRAADAEYREYRRATRQAMLEEKPLWTRDYEGPEPGATKEDLRVYTYLGKNEYKYWGIRSLDMTLEELWARNDPDNTREHITANNPRPLPAPAIPTSSKSPPPPPHAGSRSRRCGKAPDFNLRL